MTSSTNAPTLTAAVVTMNNSTDTMDSTSSKNALSDMTIEEVQHYVLDVLPPELQYNISEKTWKQLFGEESTTVRKSLIDKLANRLEWDDRSLVSIITETTGNKLEESTKQQQQQQQPHGSNDTIDRSNSESATTATWTSTPTTATTAADATNTKTLRSSFYNNNNNNNKSSSTSVSFQGGIQVRYYERILDVNPGVTNGAPIGIGWNYYVQEDCVPVEEWESQKDPNVKRSQEELKLSKHEREKLLRDSGYRSHEIADAIRSVLKAQHQRAQTVQNLNNAQFEEVMERATRKIKKLFTKGFRFSTKPSSSSFHKAKANYKQQQQQQQQQQKQKQ